jgi:ParB family chromosome partitioning protein
VEVDMKPAKQSNASGAEKPTWKKKRTEAPPKSRGVQASRLAGASLPARVSALVEAIEQDRGSVLATYRDPLGGNWQILAGLPIDLVEPTPFQRDLSDAHVERLSRAIDGLDRFLDPVIAVRSPDGMYWTPNGHHRTAAIRKLGGRSIVALVVPEVDIAYRILALNTEKAHNLRERALEVIRMAEALAELDPRPEREFEAEFEEPALLTLGLCYKQAGRFAGSAYHPVLKRIDRFLGSKLPKALDTRAQRAASVVELEATVNEIVRGLKQRGFESPYLKNFVVARINPLRFKRGAKAHFDETIEKMLRAAERFDAGKVKTDQLARASGPVSD